MAFLPFFESIMFVIGFFSLGVLLIGLQTTLFMVNPLWNASPDFYFVLVAYLAYRHDLFRSLIILFPLGLIFDVLSGVLLGMYPALFILGFLLLKFMASHLPVRESLYQVPMIGVSYLLVSWLVYVFMSFASESPLVPWSWPVMLMRAGLVILCTFPLFRVFEFFNRRIEGKISPLHKMRLRSGNRYRE